MLVSRDRKQLHGQQFHHARPLLRWQPGQCWPDDTRRHTQWHRGLSGDPVRDRSYLGVHGNLTIRRITQSVARDDHRQGIDLPLGKSGLSYRIWMDSLNRYELSLQPIAPNGNYGITAGSVRLEIIKTGELTDKVRISAGLLGTLQDDYLILKRFNLTNAIVLNSASCQTPSVPVDMGIDYTLEDFPELVPPNVECPSTLP